ncbi:NB-ARC domain-containing protein [Kitasatospora sp. NPDC091207]|uniref:NB-ARC domain-containing protein n=1 Tax=Kitasatospora sp. NPDC091207 TaxID=3364083 RepID=UPI00381048D1
MTGGTVNGLLVQAEQVHLRVTEPRWPCRVGLIPNVADAFQPRGLVRELADTPAGTTVLSGMGGVGKTQIAARHARSLLRSGGLDLVVWTAATDREAVRQSYTRAALEIGLADRQDLEPAPERLLAWLDSTDRRWLVVLDDLTDPADLRELWPPDTASGRTVATTRRRDRPLAARGRRLVDVGLFTEAQSAAYLAERLPAVAPGEAAGLAAELGHLPLALAQAAAYLDETQMLPATYRSMLSGRHPLSGLTPSGGALPDDQRAPLPAVLGVSLARADRHTGGLATPMLQLAALLDPGGIPVGVLTGEPARAHLGRRVLASKLPGPKGLLGWYGRLFDTAEYDVLVRTLPAHGVALPSEAAALAVLEVLHRFGLADLLPASDGREFAVLRVHALTQHLAHDTLPAAAKSRAAFARLVAGALQAAWPVTDHDQALAHALRANTAVLRVNAGGALWADAQAASASVLQRAGTSLTQSGRVIAAAGYFEDLRREAEERVGPEHRATLILAGEAANARGRAGDRAAAIELLGALLPVLVRVQGPDAAETLACRGDLAAWRGRDGDPAAAAKEFAAILAAARRALDPGDLFLLTARNNLAVWRSSAGDPAGGAEALEELLGGLPAGFGPDHPTVLLARANLANLRGRAGDPARAVAELRALLADRAPSYDHDHPHTLVARASLADWLGAAGDRTGAAEACRGLLDDALGALDPEHEYLALIRESVDRWLDGPAEPPAEPGPVDAGSVDAGPAGSGPVVP